MAIDVGDRVSILGGYDFEPAWLAGRVSVAGTVLTWIPGQNETPACVLRLDEPLTAEGDVRGKRAVLTGTHVVLELRYVDQLWGDTGTVHVELCSVEPANASWQEREVGAWIESHATYECPERV